MARCSWELLVTWLMCVQMQWVLLLAWPCPHRVPGQQLTESSGASEPSSLLSSSEPSSDSEMPCVWGSGWGEGKRGMHHVVVLGYCREQLPACRRGTQHGPVGCCGAACSRAGCSCQLPSVHSTPHHQPHEGPLRMQHGCKRRHRACKAQAACGCAGLMHTPCMGAPCVRPPTRTHHALLRCCCCPVTAAFTPLCPLRPVPLPQRLRRRSGGSGFVVALGRACVRACVCAKQQPAHLECSCVAQLAACGHVKVDAPRGLGQCGRRPLLGWMRGCAGGLHCCGALLAPLPLLREGAPFPCSSRGFTVSEVAFSHYYIL